MSEAKRVLIADDSVFLRTSLKRMLEKNGLQVAGMAENGIEVISCYKELKPDIVIMDIVMPQLSGREALKLLKQFDPAARVIMISSMSTKEMVMDCLATGAAHYILKPFEEDKVVATIQEMLEV